MKRSQKNRVRLSVEALEHRDAPATLTVSPPGWVELVTDPNVKEITASAQPGLATAEAHSGGVVQWSLDVAEATSAKSAKGQAHARSIHLEDSGSAVIDGLTITASATGKATHLGKFTLHDSSTIVGFEINPDGDVILHIAGLQENQQGADLEAANGDHLYASLTGSVNRATGEGTVTFEWTGGTGRFAGATGTTVWQIHLNTDDFTYTAVADGDINY